MGDIAPRTTAVAAVAGALRKGWPEPRPKETGRARRWELGSGGHDDAGGRARGAVDDRTVGERDVDLQSVTSTCTVNGELNAVESSAVTNVAVSMCSR